MTDAPRGKRAAAAFAKRLAIVEAAIRQFVEKGFHATSIRDIAAEAGISLGNLYNHFSGKAALIEEIAELEAADTDRIETAMKSAPTPDQAILRLVEILQAQLATREGAMLTAEVMAESLRNPAVAEKFARNRTRLVALISQTLGQVDPTSARAEGILDLIEGHAFRTVLAGSEVGDVTPLVLQLAGLTPKG